MTTRSFLAAVALGTALLAAPPARAQALQLESHGGATLGALTSLTVTGNPGEQYAIILSLSTGPTPIPPPHQPAFLDVGLELFTLTTTIPGFLGFLDGAGKATALLPIPFDAILLAIPPLNFQAIKIKGGAKIDGKSNLCRLIPALSSSTAPTIGDMTDLRAGHGDATLKLSDGSVLLFGGGPDGNVASYGQTAVERYDPCLQTFSVVGQMLSARTSHTGTMLNNGKILLTGGADDLLGEPVDTAELYDPVTNTSTPLPNMSTERALHSASLLPDGRVLIAGGTSSFVSPIDIILNATNTTEIFNPATNTWSAGPNMAEPRVGHRATTLADSRTLITAGYSWFVFIGIKAPRISNAAQLYTPGGGAGAFGSQISMTQSRFGHNQLLAPNGNVYVFGGATDNGAPLNPVAVTSIERYNPVTNTFTNLPSFLTKARGACAVAQLPNGIIAVCGGSFGNLATPTPDDSVDLFDTTNEVLTATLLMQHTRSNFSATPLDDGTFLLAGGGDDFDMFSNPISFADAEILHP